MRSRFIKQAFLLLVLITFLFLPGRAETKYRPGLDALYNGKYQEAIAFFKKEVERERENGDLASHASFLLGLSYFRDGQYAEAVKYLKRAMDVYKEGMKVYRLDDAWSYWLGRAYLANDQPAEAIRYLNEAAGSSLADPTRKYNDMPPTYYQVKFMKEYYIPLAPSTSVCYFWLGRAYFSHGDYEAGIAAAQKAIGLNPRDPDYYALLGACLRGAGKYNEAVAAVMKAIEFEPRSSYYWLLATIYRSQKDYDKAVESFKRAINLDPSDPDNYLEIARIYLAEDRYSEAEEILKKAPASPAVSNFLVQSLMGSGKFDQAISACDEDIQKLIITGIGLNFKIEDKYPVITTVLPTFPAEKSGLQPGDRIISVNGKPTKGIETEALRQSLNPAAGNVVNLEVDRKDQKKPLGFAVISESRIHTSAAVSYGMKSLILLLKGDLEESVRKAREAYNLNQNEVWARRAFCLAGMIEESKKGEGGNWEEVIKILSDQTQEFDRLLLSICQARAKNWEKAAENFSQISEQFLSSKNVFYQGYLDMAREAMKPYVEEKKQRIKSLEGSNRYREALVEYAALFNLSSEEEKSSLRKRLAQLRKAQPEIFVLPEEAHKRMIRAEALLEDKNYARAIQEYKEALKVAFYHPDIYRDMALAAEALKDYRQAIKSMAAYLELNPEAPDSRELKDKIIKWEFLLEEQQKR